MRQAVDCLRGEEPGELPHMAELPHISRQEVEGEAAYLAAGEAVREVAGEVTGEATGEVAAGGAVMAGGNCTASWQRAASSSTSDQRSCGGTPPVVYGMAPTR